MRFAPYLFALSLGPSLAACSGTSTATDVIPRPELVAVAPQDFLGTLHCGTSSGEVQSYVATLFDVTAPTDGGAAPPVEAAVALASSPATTCTLPVTFSYVVAGHRYLAEVDAYDRPPSALHAFGSEPGAAVAAPGGRLQLDATGAPVTPRWTTRCGGYPARDLDGGSDAGDAGSEPLDASAAELEAGAAPAPVVSYDGITQSTHYCGDGLRAR